MKLRDLYPDRFFLGTWRELDREAAEARAARDEAGQGYDFRPLIIFVSGAVLLTLMETCGHIGFLERFLEPSGNMLEAARWRGSLNHQRLAYLWWSGTRVLGYFVIPAIIIRVYGERVRDQGLSTKGLREHLWVYALCYLVVLGCVYGVSFQEEFVRYYPFYKGASRSWTDFLVWELLYGAQFFALEFFFRGWWLMGTKDQLGSHAIFVMIVPYVMIHFGKPVAETLAATIAGLVLGTLALRTRSVWSGFFVHVGVAVSMDTAALLRTTGLPTTWVPPDLPAWAIFGG